MPISPHFAASSRLVLLGRYWSESGSRRGLLYGSLRLARRLTTLPSAPHTQNPIQLRRAALRHVASPSWLASVFRHSSLVENSQAVARAWAILPDDRATHIGCVGTVGRHGWLVVLWRALQSHLLISRTTHDGADDTQVFSMDRYGRRPTALRSAVGVVVALTLLSVCFALEEPEAVGDGKCPTTLRLLSRLSAFQLPLPPLLCFTRPLDEPEAHGCLVCPC